MLGKIVRGWGILGLLDEIFINKENFNNRLSLNQVIPEGKINQNFRTSIMRIVTMPKMCTQSKYSY